jgi:hypothetical protein
MTTFSEQRNGQTINIEVEKNKNGAYSVTINPVTDSIEFLKHYKMVFEMGYLDSDPKFDFDCEKNNNTAKFTGTHLSTICSFLSVSPRGQNKSYITKEMAQQIRAAFPIKEKTPKTTVFSLSNKKSFLQKTATANEKGEAPTDKLLITKTT